MKYDAIIFDLDGTLWDSTKGLYQSWIDTIKQFPELDIPSYKAFMSVMGLTDIVLIQKLFPQLNDEDAMTLFKKCTEFENAKLSKTGGYAYEGIYELLETLSKDYTLCIVSNCGTGYIEAYMESMKTGHFFKDYECYGNTRREKWENIQSVVRRNHFENPVYIGDTELDMMSATKAGLPFVHANYGFGKFDCDFPKIEKPLDFLKLI